MKNKWKGINNFLIIACLVIVVAGIILRQLIDKDLWLQLMATISCSSVLFALSDLFKSSSDDRRSMSALSSSIVKPLYDRFSELGLLVDANGKNISKPEYVSESDFDRSLRSVSDENERVVRELVWENRNNTRRANRGRWNALCHVIFLLLSAILFLGGLVVLFVFPRWFPNVAVPNIPGGFLDIIILCSFVLALVASFAHNGSFGYFQKLDMLFALKERCLAILEQHNRKTKDVQQPAPYIPTPEYAAPAMPDPVPSSEAVRPSYSFHEEVEPQQAPQPEPSLSEPPTAAPVLPEEPFDMQYEQEEQTTEE